jgi:hypothetical protein
MPTRVSRSRITLLVAVGSVAVVVAAAVLIFVLTREPARDALPPAAESPTPAASEPAPEADPTPTATEPALADGAEEADPLAWVVTQDGIGPVLVGSSLAETATAFPDPVDMCATGAEPRAYTAGEGGHLIVASVDGEADGIVDTVHWSRWDVQQGWSIDMGPRTEAGIGLGASIADVIAAYPDAVEVVRNGQYLQAGRIYFDVTPGVVQGLGVADEVPWEFCG